MLKKSTSGILASLRGSRRLAPALPASQFIATLENRQGLKVACPEEIAYRQGWIDAAQLEKLAQPLTKSGYGQYLLRVLKEQVF